jgi:hypothetical protein
VPSWKEGGARQSITRFVSRVTTPGSDFGPVPERIAVFDNDGTLWAEQPIDVQGLFTFDRVHALAPQHAEWKTTQPFKAVLENDTATIAKGGMAALDELLMATHAGMTTDEFDRIVKGWLATARHPTTLTPRASTPTIAERRSARPTAASIAPGSAAGRSST